MSCASSSSSALRRRRPFIPVIPCPDCGRIVKQSRSETKKHNGWVFYHCQKHGLTCNFWHWELDYVGYLIGRNILQGDEGVDALGWAEERREVLMRRQEANEATAPAQDELVLKHLESLAVLLKASLLLLKIVVGLLAVICVLMIFKK